MFGFERSIFGTGLAAALIMMYLELRDVRSDLETVKDQMEFLIDMIKINGIEKK